MKKIKVILSSCAEFAFKELNELAVDSKVNNSILKSIKNKVELIKNNPHYGEPVRK